MKTFCKLPWQGLDISPQGEYKPCCKFSTSIASSMEAYRSSKELAKLKESFLLGEKPGLVFCYRHIFFLVPLQHLGNWVSISTLIF